MKKKGAIFDLDGTLLDSMWVWERVDAEFLAKRGFTVPEDYGETISPLGFFAAAEYTIQRFGLTETPEDILNEWNAMAIREYSEEIQLKPGAGKLLERLKRDGIRLAVATASHEELFVPALKKNGILELFDAVVTVQEVKRGKGFPDIYERAAGKLALAPAECVVYEDIYAGIAGAKDGGFQAVGVYDAFSARDEAKIRERADYYIRDYAELEKIYGELYGIC